MASQGLFYVERVAVPVRVAQVVGLTAAGFFMGKSTDSTSEGQGAAASYTAMPSILMAPAPLAARQWKRMYDIGALVGPAVAALGTVAFGFLAYREPTSSTQFKLYTASAVLLPSVIPYTVAVLKPINDKLMSKASSMAGTELSDKAAEAGVAQEETVHALIDKWATLNLGRAVLAGVSMILAAWAAVDRLDVIGFTEIGLTGGAERMGN